MEHASKEASRLLFLASQEHRGKWYTAEGMPRRTFEFTAEAEHTLSTLGPCVRGTVGAGGHRRAHPGCPLPPSECGCEAGGRGSRWSRAKESDADGRKVVLEVREEARTVGRILELPAEGLPLRAVADRPTAEGHAAKRGSAGRPPRS